MFPGFAYRSNNYHCSRFLYLRKFLKANWCKTLGPLSTIRIQLTPFDPPISAICFQLFPAGVAALVDKVSGECNTVEVVKNLLILEWF